MRNSQFKRFQMSDRELDDYVEADERSDLMAQRMDAENPGYLKEYERNPEEQERVKNTALMHIAEERREANRYMNQPYGRIKVRREGVWFWGVKKGAPQGGPQVGRVVRRRTRRRRGRRSSGGTGRRASRSSCGATRGTTRSCTRRSRRR